MSEKFSARNSGFVSPLRSNTFVSRGVNPSKSTSKRIGLTKTGEKINEDKKNEVKNSREGCREEFGTNVLNLTLVGSPAPRSQVRALVSSSNVAPRSKIKTSYSSKSREQHPHEICMEKLYQFADNPTKFVRLESQNEPQLQLDLEFSDRSEESENFYNSHNIAFGENGEYRIPEYDHIRFLQFSIGNNQDNGITEDQNNSASIKFDHSTATFNHDSTNAAINGEPLCEKFNAKENHISTIPDGPETPGSLPADGSLDFSEVAPQIDEINPWNSKIIQNSNWPKSSAVLQLDGTQGHPLGSAINYRNNINPEVEKFMLDTGPESLDENYTKSTQNNRLIDESILSKNFDQAIRLQPFEGSVENSSRTSPVTSRTTLSQASSGDGTWHGHSLNSPYFASTESNSWTDSKKNVNKDLSKVLASYEEENDEYLTIVKNEQDSTRTSEKGGVQKYIFITNQFIGSADNELHDQRRLESVNDCRDDQKVDNSYLRTSVQMEPDDNSSTKVNRILFNLDDDDNKDISSGNSSSDYCIGNIFSRSSSSSTTGTRSSSSSLVEETQPTKAGASFACSTSLEDKPTGVQDEPNNVQTVKFGVSEVENSNLSKESLSSSGFYMTLEEVNLAADYTSKLSQIFNRVLRRSECENKVKNAKEEEVNINCSSSTNLTTSQNTSKLIYACLGSPDFCASHLSS